MLEAKCWVPDAALPLIVVYRQRPTLWTRLCLGFSPTDLLEAFPGFSTVSPPLAFLVPLPLPGPGDGASFLFVARSSSFGFSSFLPPTSFLIGSAWATLLSQRLNPEATLILIQNLKPILFDLTTY